MQLRGRFQVFTMISLEFWFLHLPKKAINPRPRMLSDNENSIKSSKEDKKSKFDISNVQCISKIWPVCYLHCLELVWQTISPFYEAPKCFHIFQELCCMIMRNTVKLALFKFSIVFVSKNAKNRE